MRASPWRIDEHLARLEAPQSRAEIDLFNPAGGMKVRAARGENIVGARIFAIGLSSASDSQSSNVEFFARGNDLIAIHWERPDSPFRAQIYWRWIPSVQAFKQCDNGQDIDALELILSIQTSLLDSDPALEVATALDAKGAGQLTEVVTAHFSERSASLGGSGLDAESGLGCFQFELAAGKLKYLEMVHPADFRNSRLSAVASPPGLRLSHRLFAERLEKGVILRSRLRSFFVPKDCPTTAIVSAYEEFADSEPPLTV